jgi:hypothetical protein
VIKKKLHIGLHEQMRVQMRDEFRILKTYKYVIKEWFKWQKRGSKPLKKEKKKYIYIYNKVPFNIRRRESKEG